MKITNLETIRKTLAKKDETDIWFRLEAVIEALERTAMENGRLGQETLETEYTNNRTGKRERIVLDLVKTAIYDLDEDGDIISTIEEETYRIREITIGKETIYYSANITTDELAEITGKSKAWIYKLAQRFNRMPTIEEIEQTKPAGRPRKY